MAKRSPSTDKVRVAAIQQTERIVPPGSTIYWIVRTSEGCTIIDPIFIKRGEPIYMRDLIGVMGKWEYRDETSKSFMLGLVVPASLTLKDFMTSIKLFMDKHIHPDIDGICFRHILI